MAERALLHPASNTSAGTLPTDRSPHRNEGGLSHASRGVPGPGRPIGPDVLGNMEAHLGHDLSHDRIHTDESAAMSARAIGLPHSRSAAISRSQQDNTRREPIKVEFSSVTS